MINTLTLDYVVNDYGEDIFDFNYVFPDTTLDETSITKETLQQGFIDYFLYYQIGFSTIEEFKWRLKRKWHENIRMLTKQLALELNLNYNLNEESENITRQANGNKLNTTTDTKQRNSTNTHTGIQDNDNRFSDTPNQDMGSIENPNFLTERTLDTLNTTNNNTFAENQENKTTDNETHSNNESIERTKNYNEIEKFNLLSDKIRNVIYDFYKKFNGLFITDVILERGILYV